MMLQSFFVRSFIVYDYRLLINKIYREDKNNDIIMMKNNLPTPQKIGAPKTSLALDAFMYITSTMRSVP